MLDLRSRTWFIKLAHREYWPIWVYYIPVWIQHFWLSLKVRNLFFFLATNPAIDGFILSDSKFETLKLVPERYRPKSLLIPCGTPVQKVLSGMERVEMEFPVILKPDIGFRGLKVHKVENIEELTRILVSGKVNYLLQNYCKGPFEAGIFYYRYPGQESGSIPSITIKEFLKVEGNGVLTLEELVLKNPRAMLQKTRMQQKFKHIWTKVVPEDTVIELEPLGNHNRGTRFADGSYLADSSLLATFDELSHQMEGFYFGRFDVKARSWEALKNQGEFTILEINGVGGEPTHIYDSSHSLFRAWRDLCFTWRVAAGIAEENMKLGIPRPSYSKAKELWDLYTSYRSRLLG